MTQDIILKPGENKIPLEIQEMPERIAIQTKHRTLHLSLNISKQQPLAVEPKILELPAIQSYTVSPITKSSAIIAAIVIVVIIASLAIVKMKNRDSTEVLMKRCQKLMKKMKKYKHK